MIRLLFYALIFYFAYRFFKPYARSFLSPTDESARNAAQEETELIRDPHCGTYFLKQSGVTAHIDGKQMHFCSPACRDAYVRARQSR